MVILTERHFLLLALCLLMLVGNRHTGSLKLLELDVPKHIAIETPAELSCRWQLSPGDVLYSVKWYKDGKEFFRFVPRDKEPRRKFPLPGVRVEDSDTSGTKIVLSPATRESGGRYRCEVSGEGPLFPTVSEHADMTIVVLPDHGPVISGFQSKYRIGDRLHVTCTSGRSQPATQLAWYINGEPLPPEELTPSYRSASGLIVTSLGLDLEVTETHFGKNGLKVKCLATIAPVYWKSNEETAIQERTSLHHNIGATEYKDTRAARVQANYSNTVEGYCLYVLILLVFCTFW